MDWKLLTALGIAVAVVGSGSSRAASAGPVRTPDGTEPTPEEHEMLELLLAKCKSGAADIVDPAEPAGVRWPQTVAAYDAAADLYEDGEDDSFELAVEAMDAMLPGCDWGLLSESFTSEELGSGALYEVWQAADRIAYKVVADIPVDVEYADEGACPAGYVTADMEGEEVCLRVQGMNFNTVDPVEPQFDPTEPTELQFNPIEPTEPQFNP